MGKKKKGGRYTPPTHSYLYIARVIKDEEMAPGFINLTVYRDKDVIAIDEGDEFITFLTVVPLFGEGK